VGTADRVYSDLFPPYRFDAGAVSFAMVSTTERHREFIAHLKAETSRLRKAQVMGIARPPATNQAWLLGDKPKMNFIAHPPGFRNDKLALVDSGRIGVEALLQSRLLGSRYRNRGTVSIGESDQSHLEGLFHQASVGYSQSVLGWQAALCPVVQFVDQDEAGQAGQELFA
jgi:hypothetical protein